MAIPKPTITWDSSFDFHEASVVPLPRDWMEQARPNG
jgi:hypothetical protein